MELTMIFILSLGSWQKNLKNNLLLSEKTQKNTESYRLQFIGSARFMASSLSNLVNNRSERIHKIKCKYGDDDKKCELYIKTYRIIAYCDYFLEYTNFKDDLIEYKCVCCNKNYQQV